MYLTTTVLMIYRLTILLQYRYGQWYISKSPNRFAPIALVITTVDTMLTCRYLDHQPCQWRTEIVDQFGADDIQYPYHHHHPIHQYYPAIW
jgi:hypothetical protein